MCNQECPENQQIEAVSRALVGPGLDPEVICQMTEQLQKLVRATSDRGG